jgi:predicted extracellular nuclease
VVNSFVDELVAANPQANVIVLGDINDFEFSETVELLEGGVLTTLMDTLPKAERYSYVFEGNSQVLDQILVSANLLGNFPIDYDPVHVNAEFADQASDHDPQVARLDLRGRPSPT